MLDAAYADVQAIPLLVFSPSPRSGGVQDQSERTEQDWWGYAATVHCCTALSV